MIQYSSENVIKVLKQLIGDACVIIEAGAFDGSDTLRLSRAFPETNIFAIEPLPERFKQLQDRFKDSPQVICIPAALSDHEGTAVLYVAENPVRPGRPSQASSLHEPTGRLTSSPIRFPHHIIVPTITLESLCTLHNIQSIDLLWLDTQGHELRILHAAQTLLSVIKYMHLEVGFTHNYANQPLYPEVKKWLENHGFEIIGQDFNHELGLFGNIMVRNTRYNLSL